MTQQKTQHQNSQLNIIIIKLPFNCPEIRGIGLLVSEEEREIEDALESRGVKLTRAAVLTEL